MVIKTKEEFDNLIDRIKNLVLRYENNVCHYNAYQMYLANGEKLSFEVSEKSIPHLLGIRLDYLRSTNLFKSQDAYELLKEFLENSYSIYRSAQEGHLSFHSIFSDHIELKLEAFERIIYYFDPNEIEFVCKYDKSKTFQLGMDKNYPCDYFIAKKDDNGNLFLLGLIRQGNGFMPMTNVVFPNDEYQFSNLKGLLMNQVLTFSNTIQIDNFVKPFQTKRYLFLQSKLDKIGAIKKYTDRMKGVSVDVSSDYQFLLKGNIAKENKINEYKMFAQNFAKKIQEHEVVSLEDMGVSLDVETVNMVNTYNNEACKMENGKAQVAYSDLLKEYKELVEKVTNLEKQLEESLNLTTEYFQKIQALETENLEYKAFQEEVFDVVTRQKRKKDKMVES